MRIPFILLISILASSALQSQDKLWLPSGDTIQGSIQIVMPDKFYEEIVFEDSDGKERMKAYDFVGFEKDGELYRSIKNGDVYQIMKLTKTGYLSLYSYRMEQGYNFGGIYAVRADGFGQDVPNMGFKKRMSDFLEDCNSVSMDIQDGKLKRRDIEKIVDLYNACIQTRTEELGRPAPKKEAPASVTEKTEVTEESDLLMETQAILTEARASGDQELSSMLADVVGKLKSNEPVPGYLKSALRDQVGEDSPLYARIQNLLKEL